MSDSSSDNLETKNTFFSFLLLEDRVGYTMC